MSATQEDTSIDVLTEIADIVAETLELQDVFARIAASVRRVIPFDNMGVVRIVDGDRAILHASTLPGVESGNCIDHPMPLSAWSPRWRPSPAPNRRINDAQAELDPSYPMDAEVLRGGLGSGLWEPFKQGESFIGGVWLCSQAKYAFGDEHQRILRPIAALLGSAVEHWKIWDTELRRQERLDKLEALLATLAESLDVREIFQRVSDEMQPILPHHMMTLSEIDTRARTLRIAAFAGECDVPVATHPIQISDKEMESACWPGRSQRTDFEIIHDIPAELAPDTERQRLIISSGLRSWLRVPVSQSGVIKGGLSFLHREPFRYKREDAEVALRLADRIALTLSLRQLAEEARISAEARERAERLEATVESLARELEARGPKRIVGVSPSWRETLRAVGRVAPSETTALITGESGTGKEVISKLIHQGSPRSRKPFVAINCAALPEQLLESELFGHEKGAFTGAIATKIGRIEQAAGGTLFLDEIAEMSPTVQAKLLRVLEEREFQRLGGSRTLAADIRVIAATNRDLAVSIERKAFREDLYYRLNVFEIHIAPLRERQEDILPLAEALLDDLGRTMGRPAAGISRDAQEWFLTYPWPGNVRELRNAIERAILLCDGGLVTRHHLPSLVERNGLNHPASASGAAKSLAGDMNIETVERDLIEKALAQAKGNKSKAARIVGLTRSQLYSRLDKFGLR